MMAVMGTEYLRVKVGDEELFFKVKQKTSMGRLMTIYSEKVNEIIKSRPLVARIFFS